jgi:hypothetical protein
MRHKYDSRRHQYIAYTVRSMIHENCDLCSHQYDSGTPAYDLYSQKYDSRRHQYITYTVRSMIHEKCDL